MKRVAVLLALFTVLTGCARHYAAEPNASPTYSPSRDKTFSKFTNQADCETAGGHWNFTLNMCEPR